MHLTKLSVRLVALLAVIAGVMLAFSSLSGGSKDGAQALGDLTGTSCADIYLDIPPLQVSKGDPPGAEDLAFPNNPVGKSLTRTEANGPDWDVTTVTYLGPDNDAVPQIPDHPPSADTCAVKRTNGKTDPEANRLEPDVKYAHVTNDRPTATATLTGNNLVFTTCEFSEALGVWTRTDVDSHATDKTAQSINYGHATLYLGVSSAPACAPHGPETGTQCENAVDDDGDSEVNDGCPAVGAAETGNWCGKNSLNEDNDGATAVNDGCPAVSTTSFGAILAIHGRADTTDNTVLNPTTPADPDGTAGNPVPFPQPADGDTLPDDWDGDGCTDWDELANPAKAGRDPFNPEDCDKNYTGVYNILATAAPATKDGAGNLVPGSYFHCVGRLDHTKTGNPQPIDGAVLCFIDSPALGGLAASALPERADGLAGAPPPPPYTTGVPTVVTGSYDTTTNMITISGCFNNIGPPLGPNVIVEATFSGKSLKGEVDIYGNQSNADCAAVTFDVSGPNRITIPDVPLELSEQDDGFDHDADGCSDFDELQQPTPPTGCGDDPTSPLDSDGSHINNVGNLLVTVAQANWDEVAGAAIPGAYFHCITDNNPNTGTGDPNDFLSRLMCYQDSALSEVNPQGYPGVFGDGLPGTPPPRQTAPQVFGDVDSTHTQVNGVFDGTDTLTITGCFQNVEGTLGPNVYTNATIDAFTGQGTVKIFPNQANAANCKAGTTSGDQIDCDLVVGPPVVDCPIEVTEQFDKTGVTAQNVWDTDLDGCTDKQELRASRGTGGLRDPYNRWDFADVPTGSTLARDRSVSGADISAVVGRFGSNDATAGKFTRTSDPLSTPNPPITPSGSRANYHPAYDRGGSIVGSNPWNLKPPNGAVDGGDISAAVGQFGNNCLS
jgi:hypothetical protein